MEWIGDIERAIATSIYPNRVPIALAVLAGALLLTLVAWRRRWDRPLRAHPRAVTLAAVATLAVGGPIAWYLASPLVLSREIDEPAPVVATTATPLPSAAAPAPSVVVPAPSVATPESPQATPATIPTASPTAAATARPTPTPTPPPTPTPTPLLIELTGTFTGADEFHFGEGTARVIETASGAFVVRLEDFAVRNGPDLFVYLSPSSDGYADGALELGRLKADRGNQNYAVPAGTDPASYASVVIWCRQFSVLFATAPLAPVA